MESVRNEPIANRRHKDSMFRNLFANPEHALSLYNALSGTSYGDPRKLKITTLDDVLYLNVKNDISFLIENELVLWEHQSTHNPNMPFRGLQYFSRLYSAWLDRGNRNDPYSGRLIPLPLARYVVFYIGKAARQWPYARQGGRWGC